MNYNSVIAEHVLMKCENNLGIKLSDMEEVPFGMGAIKTYKNKDGNFFYHNNSTGELSRVSETNVFLPMLKQRFQ